MVTNCFRYTTKQSYHTNQHTQSMRVWEISIHIASTARQQLYVHSLSTLTTIHAHHMYNKLPNDHTSNKDVNDYAYSKHANDWTYNKNTNDYTYNKHANEPFNNHLLLREHCTLRLVKLGEENLQSQSLNMSHLRQPSCFLATYLHTSVL